MKRFWELLCRFVPPYKKYLIAYVGFTLISTMFTLFSFMVVVPILEILFKVNDKQYQYMELADGRISDVIFNNFYYYTQEVIAQYGASSTLALLGLLLVGMTALKTGSTFLASYFIIPLRSGLVRDIRNELYDKVVSLPIGFFSVERKGDVMARMSGDVAEVENSVASSLDMLFRNPIIIIITVTAMVMVSWQLSLFVFALLPLAGAVMGKIGRKLKRTSLEQQNCWGAALSNIEETLGGLRIIKAFNAENKVKNRFHAETQTYFRLSNRVARRQSLAHPMSELLGTLTIAIVLWFGGSLILSGNNTIDAPTFIYFLVLFYTIINPAKELSKSWYTIEKGMAALERVDKIMGATNPITDPEHPQQIQRLRGEVKYNDVSFSYDGHTPVAKNVSFTIEPGQTVALVGQSGSGKSTLADLLPRFYDVDNGSITVDGIDIRDLTVHSLRSLMGNVNQEAILFNDTFYNNISFGVEHATPEQVMAAAKIANAHDFITATELGYQTNIGDRGCRLSGGQRQRISIARAILKNPPILILDEATSALDSESEQQVQQALERLMKDRTTLVIAHRLSTIKNASLICVINEGRIVEQGTHDQLMALDGAYARLVAMQNVK